MEVDLDKTYCSEVENKSRKNYLRSIVKPTDYFGINPNTNHMDGTYCLEPNNDKEAGSLKQVIDQTMQAVAQLSQTLQDFSIDEPEQFRSDCSSPDYLNLVVSGKTLSPTFGKKTGMSTTVSSIFTGFNVSETNFLGNENKDVLTQPTRVNVSNATQKLKSLEVGLQVTKLQKQRNPGSKNTEIERLHKNKNKFEFFDFAEQPVVEDVSDYPPHTEAPATNMKLNIEHPVSADAEEKIKDKIERQLQGKTAYKNKNKFEIFDFAAQPVVEDMSDYPPYTEAPATAMKLNIEHPVSADAEEKIKDKIERQLQEAVSLIETFKSSLLVSLKLKRQEILEHKHLGSCENELIKSPILENGGAKSVQQNMWMPSSDFEVTEEEKLKNRNFLSETAAYYRALYENKALPFLNN